MQRNYVRPIQAPQIVRLVSVSPYEPRLIDSVYFLLVSLAPYDAYNSSFPSSTEFHNLHLTFCCFYTFLSCQILV